MNTSGVMSFTGGNGNTATLQANGTWTDASDATYKENVTDIQYGLADIRKLSPRSFTYKGDGSNAIGFIAQELKDIIPEVVFGTEGSYTVSYGALSSLALQGVKELDARTFGLATVGTTTASTTAVLTIDTDTGRVGVGTSTPQRLLHVSNDGALSQLLLEDQVADVDQRYGALGFSRGGFSFDTLTDAFATTTRMTIAPSGNIGIGTTTPQARLSLTQATNTPNGGFLITEAGNTDFRSIFMNTDGVLNFYGGNTEGTLNTATLQANGQFTNASDQAYKSDVRDIAYGLEDIRKLTPRSFTYTGTEQSGLGFIAQELKMVIPEVVYGVEGGMSVDYASLSALALRGVQELDMRTMALSTTTMSLAERLSGVEAMVAPEEPIDIEAEAIKAAGLVVEGTATAEQYLATVVNTPFAFGSSTLSAALPSEVLFEGRADLYQMTSYAIAGMQEALRRTDLVMERLATIEDRIAELEMIASTTPAVPVFDFTPFMEILESLEIREGMLAAMHFVADRLTIGSPEKPTGVTFFDEVTGEPYCLAIRNGAQVIREGECEVVDRTQPEPTPAPTPTPTPAPVPAPEPIVTPEPTPEPGFEPVFPGDSVEDEVEPEPTPEPTPTPAPVPAPEPAPEPEPEPVPEPTPAPAPAPAPAPVASVTPTP